MWPRSEPTMSGPVLRIALYLAIHAPSQRYIHACLITLLLLLDREALAQLKPKGRYGQQPRTQRSGCHYFIPAPSLMPGSSFPRGVTWLTLWTAAESHSVGIGAAITLQLKRGTSWGCSTRWVVTHCRSSTERCIRVQIDSERGK